MSEVTEQPAAAPESQAAPEAAAPETQAIESQAEGLLNEIAEGTPDGLEQPITEELEEIEYEGKKAKVPKELRDAFLRQQDYTRKTQEVAAQRQQVEQQVAEFQRTAQFHQQHIGEVAKVISIDERLQQFRQLNWDQLTEADPVQAAKLDRQMRNLEAERSQLTQSISQKQQALAFQAKQATARQMEEGQRALEREIKGWSPELQKKLAETAKSIGYKSEELAQVSDPRAVKLLHKAYLYDQMMAQRTAKPAAVPATPVTRIQARASTAVTDPDTLSTDEWKKWRENQLAAQRKQR